MATTTTKISSTATSPQTPNFSTTTTEQTGIHYNSLYLHTVPGTLKCVCLVNVFPAPSAIQFFFLMATKFFVHLDFCDFRIYLHTMQRIQSNGYCTILQHRCNDLILVHGHLTSAISISCGLCVQQNPMDENWIFLLCERNTFTHADIIASCCPRSWFIHSSCGTFIVSFIWWLFDKKRRNKINSRFFRSIYSFSDMSPCAPTAMTHS